MPDTYQVYETVGRGRKWNLPNGFFSKFGLIQNQKIILRFGSLSTEARVVSSSLTDSADLRMGFSEDVFKALKIPKRVCLGINFLGPGEFRIGPIIGMMTYARVIAKRNFSGGGKYSKIIRRYAAYAEKMKNSGLFYLFAPENIHMKTRTITGYRYEPESGSWEAGEFAYPDVVMDRIYPNNVEAHRKLECIIGPNRIFNKKTMIDKWEFFTTLRDDPVLRKHIPDTLMFNQKSDLVQFFARHKKVFLKPRSGMKGKGIIYITIEDNVFFCRYMRGREVVTRKAADSSEVRAVLGAGGIRQTSYIIQKAIQRMEYKQRPFNFRVMLTKNGSGDWNVRAIFAKIAPRGSFLTNRSLGADYVLLRDLFEAIESQISCTKEEFLELVNCLAFRAASRLDKKFGPLGKLGLDVVMDTSGKPWLIEANGNPGSICPKVLSEFPAWAGQVFDDPIAYSLYLSGFSEI